jgi:hypothetical protein
MIDSAISVGPGSPTSPAVNFFGGLPNTGFYVDGAGIVAVVNGALASRITGSGVLQGNGPIQVTGSALAATANGNSVVITTEALATAAGAVFTYVLTDANINANSNVQVTVSYGTATAGVLVVQKVVPGAGTVSITVLNLSATSPAGASLNGTLKIGVLVQ